MILMDEIYDVLLELSEIKKILLIIIKIYYQNYHYLLIRQLFLIQRKSL